MGFYSTSLMMPTGRRPAVPQTHTRVGARTRESKNAYPRPPIAVSGLRFYSPNLHIWLSRDPIGERDGANLYCALGNDAVSQLDLRGLKIANRVTDGGNTVVDFGPEYLAAQRELRSSPFFPVK